MAEEMLLGNVSGTLFPDRDETEISDLKKTSLFSPIALDDEQPKLVFTPSELDRLADFRDASAIDSNDPLGKLVDDAIAQNSGLTNDKVPNPPNDASPTVADDSSKNPELSGVPEEGGDDKNDKNDDSGSDPQTLEGTDDDDLIVATGANQSLYGKKGNDTLRGSASNERHFGGKGNDDCAGDDGDDEVRGDRGDDKCDGGEGNDTLSGGKDKDTLSGGTGNDTCKGDDDDDWVHGNDGKDDVDGGSGSDTLYGGKGDDTCKGGEGNDTVRGDRGNDKCDGGEGNDTVNGGKDNDTVIGGAGSDDCSGDDGDDTVMGGSGDDTTTGGAGNDDCSGDEGDDSVVGGDGKDTLIGGEGNDTCSGDEGDDSVVGGAGDDSVVGGTGNDTLVTGDGSDMADGGSGDDSVAGGGSGDDTLMGGSGNDTIVGGTGNHTCSGGAGNDVFVMDMGNNTTPGSSVITDYEDGFDKILLSGSLNFSSLLFIQVGLNTEIRLSSNQLVLALLLNVSATILNAGDFLGVNGSSPNPTPTPTPTPTPSRIVDTPPRSQTNKPLTVGSDGNPQTITGDLLKFVDNEQSASETTFKLTELPDAKTGKLFFKGAEVTQVGLTFTQVDISLGLLTFQAVKGFSGAASFGFEVSDGKNILTSQRFSFKVEQNIFNFAGNTNPQVIVGSLTLDNDIEGGDGDDDIKGGKAKDKIKGGKGKDKIKGDDGDDDIDGGDDDDDIEGGNGKNKIIGGKGKDTIKGGDDGENDIDGGDDDDNIIGGKGKNTLKGALGKDTIKGGDGENDIDGGDDDDDIIGGKVKDKLTGGIGNDKLTGDDGDDELDGGEGTNTLSGGAGRNRFIYRVSREKIKTVVDADLITDFKADEDLLELSAAAFGNLSVTSLTRLAITATSAVGSIGSANLLDFSADITVTSIATLQARFAALGGNMDSPTFCQFTDADTGRSVLVFAVGARFEIVTSFSLKFSLQIRNFVFTGPALNVPVGTDGPDNFNFGTYPAGVNFNAKAGDDNIVGSNFNDTINGGDGNDTITGGLGADVLSGGTGADLFVYTTTKEGGDKITDFKAGTDKFQFVSSEFGNLTTTNFDGVSGSTPDITGKELVIFTGGTYASLEAAQAKALGSSTTPGFFVYTNTNSETVLVFDSNGTTTGGFTTVANLGTAAGTLGTADFLFTGAIATSPTPVPPSNSIVDLTAPGNTYPSASNNFGSGVGGYNFSTPVLFTGDAKANNVTGTQFADIFSGGSGADILTGGSGADIFAYNAPGEGGDTITDFAFGVDKFKFVSGAFGNLTTTNFDGVTGSTPDITGKELVIFTGGNYSTVEAAQAKALGSSTTPGFFVYTNTNSETVLVFDSNGTTTGGFTTVANLGTAAGTLGTADFLFTGATGSAPTGTSTNSSSIVDLTANPGTFPASGVYNFGSGAGGYNFTTPVLFTGNSTVANNVTGTELADILNGGGGADTIAGGGGADTITGGAGVDILTGGSGADIFAFKAPGDGPDTITDFTFGTDKLQFTANAFGNLTSTNFVSASGSNPDITGKQLVIFTGANYSTVEAAQAKAVGGSTTPGFFVYTNTNSETVLVFDSNGTATGGFTTVANLGTAAGTLGTADFVFTGTISSAPAGTTTNSSSIVDLTANPGTFPTTGVYNFGSGAGGYNFTTPVLFTGNSTVANNVTGTEFSDILNGGSGADSIFGGAGNDSISGGAGNDSLNGGAGNDTLIGGLGTNALSGGLGSDVFVFTGTTAGGGDIITDYSIVDDVMNIDKIAFAGLGSGPLGTNFYLYSSTVATVSAIESTLTSPSIIALFDSAANTTKLYYDSNGSTVGGNSLFATVNVNLGVSGNSELFLF
jgi:Ca2+-binding RTX toxin-like protein